MENKMKTRSVYCFIGLVISALALTSVASLSSYSHQTDNNLMETQAQYQALQKEYDQLKADHASLNADYESLHTDYDQVKNDLEAANNKVASLKNELETSKAKNEKLVQTINIARLNMDVLDGLFDPSLGPNEITARVTMTGDSELRKKWNAINSQESLAEFIVYLTHVTRQTLN